MLGDFQERLLSRLKGIEKAIEKLSTRENTSGGASVAATIENVSNPGGNIDVVGTNGIVATGDNTAKTITVDGAELVRLQTVGGATTYQSGHMGLTDPTVPAVNVQAGAAQSVPVAQFVDSTAVEFASINPTSGGTKGIFRAAQSAARNAFEAILSNTGAKGLFIKLGFGHTANAIEVESGSGGTIFKVDANGYLTTGIANVTGGSGQGINLTTGTPIAFGSGASMSQPSGGFLDIVSAVLRVASGIRATSGDIQALSGNVSASGTVTAGTIMSAGSGITAGTTVTAAGNITTTGGDLVAPQAVISATGADVAIAATSATGSAITASSTGGSALFATGNAAVGNPATAVLQAAASQVGDLLRINDSVGARQGGIEPGAIADLKKVELDGIVWLERGTSFPTSPAPVNRQRFIRTDRPRSPEYEFRTDVTGVPVAGRWGTDLIALKLRPLVSANPTPQGTNILTTDINLNGNLRVQIEEIQWTFVAVSAAQSGVNRYDFTASLLTNSGGNAPLTLSGNTSTSAVTATNVPGRGTISVGSSLLDGGTTELRVTMTQAGTPGTYHISATAYIRYFHD
jgi:hypothetical protein